MAAALVVLVTLAFLGLSWHITQAMLSPGTQDAPRTGSVEPAGPLEMTAVKGETSQMMVLAMVLGLIGLVVLGVHPPAQLDNLLHDAAAELGAAR
jgi:hydrogenase-4 component F